MPRAIRANGRFLLLFGVVGLVGLTAAACGEGAGDEGPVDAGQPSGGAGGSVAQATGGAPATGGVPGGGTGGASQTGGGAGSPSGQGGQGGRATGGRGGATGGSASGGAAGGAGGARGPGGGGSSTGGRAGAPGGGGSTTPAAITVWLAGDSTMANGSTPCPVGWGKVFQPLFEKGATIVNSAVGGRSIRTWLYNVQTTMDSSGECNLARDSKGEPTLQARWQDMLTKMKAGDYLLIQFGINDSSGTCDRHVGTAAFQESLLMMADAAEARGAHPVFITPVSSISCSGSKAIGSRGAYSMATKSAASKGSVPLIDLEALSVALYNKLAFCPVPGGDVSASTSGAVGDFFCDDHTHFSTSGATEIAKVVAEAFRSQGLPLAQYLR